MAAAELTIAERSTQRLQPATRDNNGPDPFEPQSWPQLLEFANMVSKTAFAPKDFMGKPEACAIAMLYGRQLGIGGLQAIQNIAVINGRPSVYGDLFWAIITSHPDFVDCVEDVTDEQAICTLTRRGQTPKTVTFSKKDAEKASLWGKAGPWTQYPKNQMLWRARTFAGRFLFADALKGLTSSVEADDYSAGPTIDGDRPNAEIGKAIAETIVAPVAIAKITQDQAREFGKAWKASAFTIAEAKSELKTTFGVEASLDLPADKYEDAMRWATKNPLWPTASTPASRDEEIAREMFGILGYDLTRQAQAIDESKGSWAAVVQQLNAELPTE